MKIVATVRARNEADNIGRFCAAYQNIADAILVADGGSTDNTISIASGYHNVFVRSFNKTIKTKDGGWINAQGSHVNFLIAWALEVGADWIIFDDCDCVPNVLIQRDLRRIVESLKDEPAIYARRAYLWGEDQYFTQMGHEGACLWMWRKDTNISADTEDEWHLRILHNKKKTEMKGLRKRAFILDFPYCLLHYFCPTPEYADKKAEWYRKTGIQPGALHPKEFGGPIKPIKEWMKWKYE